MARLISSGLRDKCWYNIVERSIRPITLGRKNWLFADSDESARNTASKHLATMCLARVGCVLGMVTD